ncbi:hypothetical protein CCS77_0990 [Campylobacter concisus]|uniref:Uncharacterized protein n=1 Tax=Campylobacter concisus TaxID=199 RepID=A0A2R4P0V1_9BACT|nr:hypothetical protein CCS77_0990 [Campylobacter concisus]
MTGTKDIYLFDFSNASFTFEPKIFFYSNFKIYHSSFENLTISSSSRQA